MSEQTMSPLLTKRFEEALVLASDLHRLHLRKSTEVPYVSHLMSVAALVLEDSGTEDEAIAALLHDALEDCGDRISGADIEKRFGTPVREIVEACTDTPLDHTGGKKPDWKPRKQQYIDHIRKSGVPNRVSLADKVHNARCILRDHRIKGEAVWNRFTPDRDETLWYYRELAAAYREAGAEGFLIDELDRTIREVEARSLLQSAEEAAHRPK